MNCLRLTILLSLFIYLPPNYSPLLVHAAENGREEEEEAFLPSSSVGQVLVCLDDGSLPSQRHPQDHLKEQQRALQKWHAYWRKISQFWLPSSTSWNPFSSLTSSSRQEEAEYALSASLHRVATRRHCGQDVGFDRRDGHSCQVLQVHSNQQQQHIQDCNSEDDATPPSETEMYELLEPLELELGDRKIKHIEDYAYSPVIYENNKFSVEPFVDHSQEIQQSFLSWSASSPWWNPLLWKSTSKTNNYEAVESYRSRYKLNEEAFAGGSHGEVWRGRRKCFVGDLNCDPSEPLIFKRLKVDSGGFRILEAGLREVYFGNLLRGKDDVYQRHLFTQYDTHFFGENGELWIVFKDAGPSLRSCLYTGTNSGDYVVFTHSWLWTLIRMSLADDKHEENRVDHPLKLMDLTAEQENSNGTESSSVVGRQLMGTFLQQILESAAALNSMGIVHRDIKPSNVMCKSNVDFETLESLEGVSPQLQCVLGDFSSAYNLFTSRNLYSRRPSRLEQTDEYAPPEAIFGHLYNNSALELTPSFDSWSIGIVALELLLGTPNVFSVDQRTRMVLSHKMQKKGATKEEIEKAMYLAALSQFCIYNPSNPNKPPEWPLRDGDPLHKSAMTKRSCTLNDFHRALRARDPLGWGFERADLLLHLIWQLLAWDPKERMTTSEALLHPYFATLNAVEPSDAFSGDHTALESQMLDPRMDFNISDNIDAFTCPKCGRVFGDWKSCHSHANSRRHAKFCSYDHSTLPTCLNAHSMLPAHSYSGYCDIQGRRPTIEDFHAIHLLPFRQFYAILDGHLGNAASKFASSFLYSELVTRLNGRINTLAQDWKEMVEQSANEAFAAVHKGFLEAIARAPYGFMDQSGTTATALLVTDGAYIIASLGDSRAVLSKRKKIGSKFEFSAVQLTKDHVASDPEERKIVESRGGTVVRRGIDRVDGTLAITRSIGDSALSPYLSREPHVISMTLAEILDVCGGDVDTKNDDADYPCFIILASDGLWDTIGNQEAVDLVALTITESIGNASSWREVASMQQAAEALTHEAYVRGSSDNIGVCIIAID